MDIKEFMAQDWVKAEIISRLDYDPETGKLTWKKRGCPYFDRYLSGKEMGYKSKTGSYKNHTMKLEIGGRKVTTSIGRLCWLVHTGDWPEHTVEHKNRDSWDNRWSNLEDITQAENNKNKGAYKKRPLKHIHYNKGNKLWHVRFGGKHYGSHKCLGKAIKARNHYLSLDIAR